MDAAALTPLFWAQMMGAIPLVTFKKASVYETGHGAPCPYRPGLYPRSGLYRAGLTEPHMHPFYCILEARRQVMVCNALSCCMSTGQLLSPKSVISSIYLFGTPPLRPSDEAYRAPLRPGSGAGDCRESLTAGEGSRFAQSSLFS